MSEQSVRRSFLRNQVCKESKGQPSNEMYAYLLCSGLASPKERALRGQPDRHTSGNANGSGSHLRF